jgi:hypothetical protein
VEEAEAGVRAAAAAIAKGSKARGREGAGRHGDAKGSMARARRGQSGAPQGTKEGAACAKKEQLEELFLF